jgi:hypothetical protein
MQAANARPAVLLKEQLRLTGGEALFARVDDAALAPEEPDQGQTEFPGELDGEAGGR